MVSIPQRDFDDCDFGDFKQDLDSPRATTATIRHRKTKSNFRYESGYASMAPIHYFKFWRVKWPAWRQTHLIELKKK